MNLADELRKLAELREAGHLTEQEFADAKRRLLAETGAQSPQPKKSGRSRGFGILLCVLVGGVIVLYAISKLGNPSQPANKIPEDTTAINDFKETDFSARLETTKNIAKSMRVQADIEAIKTQLQLYKSITGFYPTTEQGLQALVTQPQNDPRPTRWYQLFKELPKDPWGSDYIYRYPGVKNPDGYIYRYHGVKNPDGYDLFSAGPDRQPDTTDDDWGAGASS
jgi:hypothetical protein